MPSDGVGDVLATVARRTARPAGGSQPHAIPLFLRERPRATCKHSYRSDELWVGGSTRQQVWPEGAGLDLMSSGQSPERQQHPEVMGSRTSSAGGQHHPEVMGSRSSNALSPLEQLPAPRVTPQCPARLSCAARCCRRWPCFTNVRAWALVEALHAPLSATSNASPSPLGSSPAGSSAVSIALHCMTCACAPIVSCIRAMAASGMACNAATASISPLTTCRWSSAPRRHRRCRNYQRHKHCLQQDKDKVTRTRDKVIRCSHLILGRTDTDTDGRYIPLHPCNLGQTGRTRKA